jgi:hypothetical protein
VAFLDDDDLWAPDKLAAQLRALVRGSAGFAYADALYVDEHLRFLKFMPAPAAPGLAGALVGHNVIPAGGSNVIASRELLDDIGGFDEQFAHVADWDLWIRLARAAPAARCARTLVGYVEHPGGLHVRQAGDLWADFGRLRAKLALPGAGPSEPHFARFVASAHRRTGRRGAALRQCATTFARHRTPGDLARAASIVAGERVTALARAGTTASARRRVPPWIAEWA